MAFVPEGQVGRSQARSAWVAMQRGSVPEGRSKSLSVPQIVETELMPLQRRQVFLWKSSGPMMFDLILDLMMAFPNTKTLFYSLLSGRRNVCDG
jgi:hypothetical protein